MIHMPTVPEIAPAELVRRIESREEIHILDVRAPFRLENGRIDIVSEDRFHNVPGSQLLALKDPARSGLPRGVPIAVVCGHGNDSRVLAHHLNANGFEAASLTGGMSAWMSVTIDRELEPPPGCDRFVQFDRIGKGALGYVLVSDGEALIVDPPRDVMPMLALVREEEARLVGIADTHAHADYISGAPALAREVNVPYYLHPADSVYPYDGTPGRIRFEPIESGRTILVGKVAVEVVHTPGHTEGSVSFRIGDDAVLTGDFIFISSIGRPDLGGKVEEWTQVLWKSLERARATWPGGIRVFPAHYSPGAERNVDGSVGAAFEALPDINEPLAIPDRAAFTDWILSRAGAFPEAYRRIKAINIGLESPGEGEMDELEAGRNQCALG